MASELAEKLELVRCNPGEDLIKQDAPDSEIFFILSGRVTVLVNGREVAVRKSGQHVGEMAMIDPSARRCATVRALEETVAAKVIEPVFAGLAEVHPRLWRLIGLELGDRLRQRNALVMPPNPRPVLFIASSKESLPIARAIQSGLRYDDVLVRAWTDGVFGASNFAIDDLQDQVVTSDFAVIVLGPDDRVNSRAVEKDAPRDNVTFELGLFMGALTRKRTILVQPRGADLKIPSDLLGLTPIEYLPGKPEDLPANIAPVCDDIRKLVMKLKVK